MPIPAFIRPQGLVAGVPLTGTWPTDVVPVIHPTGIEAAAPQVGAWTRSGVPLSPAGVSLASAPTVGTAPLKASGVGTVADDSLVIYVDAPLVDVLTVDARLSQSAAAVPGPGIYQIKAQQPGKIIRLQTGLDLTTATTITVRVRRSDGSLSTYPAARSALDSTAADLPLVAGMFDATDDIAVDLEVAMPGKVIRTDANMSWSIIDMAVDMAVVGSEPIHLKSGQIGKVLRFMTGIDLSSAVALAVRVLRGTTILTYAATKNSLDPAAADLTIAAGMFDTDETLTAEVAATFPAGRIIRTDFNLSLEIGEL